MKLMTRVGARILEIFQNTFDKINKMVEDFEDKHKKVKTNLMKILNQADKIDITSFLKLIVDYLQEKHFDELTRLEKMIHILEEGTPDKLYMAYEKKQPPKTEIVIVPKKEKNAMTKLKEEVKNQEKIKKKKNKVAQKLVNNLYSTMDIAKQSLLDDFVFTNEKERYKKLYDEIFTRN